MHPFRGLCRLDCCSQGKTRNQGRDGMKAQPPMLGRPGPCQKHSLLILEKKHQSSSDLASLGYNAFCFRVMILVPKHTREIS